MTRLLPAAALALVAALAHAQTAPPPIPSAVNGATRAKAAVVVPPADDCGQCGRVISIRQTILKEQWTPLGTTASAGVAGDAQAVTQFKIGKGGVTERPMIGAGGAANPKSANTYEKPRWDVAVKLDSGQTRVVQLAYEPYFQEGDRVRIAGRNVELLD